MGQKHGQRSDAAVVDAQIKLSREECAKSMEQRLNINDAALKDAQVLFKREECALSMGQKLNTNDAILKDVEIKSSKEECVLGMGQRSSYAAVKDAQINPNGEEYARDTVHSATITSKLQLKLSHHMLDLNLI